VGFVMVGSFELMAAAPMAAPLEPRATAPGELVGSERHAGKRAKNASATRLVLMVGVLTGSLRAGPKKVAVKKHVRSR
jgi:hypothetical protein